MRPKFLLLILCVFVSLLIPVEAPGAKGACAASDVIKEAAKLKSSGDDAKDLVALQLLAKRISAANITCNGYVFEGKGSKVFDPFDLPKGTYRIVLSGSDISLVTVTLEGLGGEYCSGVVAGMMSESAVETSGCRAVLAVTAVSMGVEPSWKITFESLK